MRLYRERCFNYEYSKSGHIVYFKWETVPVNLNGLTDPRLLQKRPKYVQYGCHSFVEQ